MPTYRMIYDLNGKRKEINWAPEPGDDNLPAFARWLMSQEFPGVALPSDGMKKFLRAYGITDIRSPDLQSYPVSKKIGP